MEGRNHYKKGLWTVEEDDILMEYIRVHGKGHWNRVAKMTGLKRCGKSCRLRWMNYLSPNIKRGDFSEEEDDLIIRLHKLLGNRWSLIAGRVPGRTDNQVKNHWNTHLSKKLGIKKEKRKIGASSQAHYREVGKTLSPTIDLDSKLPNDSNGGEECPQNVIEASDTQEQMMNPFFVSSSWYSNDDLNLNTPSLMEFLDGYPLDLVWPGL